jgi:hypothetical protein
MNKNQKKILMITISVIMLMLIFPPFQASDYHRPSVVHNLGYSFIASPPRLPVGSTKHISGTVNVGLLFMQWMGVAVVGAGLIFIAKN